MFAASTPLISERTALICAVLYTVLYVAPFYLSTTLRASPLASRDAPSVIRARVRAVGLTCLACTTITVFVLIVYGNASPQDVLRLLGLWPIYFVDILKAVALLAVLFIGPLYEGIIVDGNWREWSLSAFKAGIFDDWRGYRNYLIAPASEELVFRAATIPLFALAKVNPTRIVFLTPLIFGLAHVHHLVEFVQSRTPQGRIWPPMNVLAMGLLRSTFQFSYTSLFGFFAAFLFLRTGNLWAVMIAHTFCNWQGVPRLYGRVGQYASAHAIQLTPDVAQGKRDDDHDQATEGKGLMQDKEETETKAAEMMDHEVKNPSIAWTLVYYALLATGALGFYTFLWPLTNSSNALATF